MNEMLIVRIYLPSFPLWHKHIEGDTPVLPLPESLQILPWNLCMKTYTKFSLESNIITYTLEKAKEKWILLQRADSI